MFSVFKAHHSSFGIYSLLVDKNDKIVPFNVFKTEALKLSNKHLKSWLKTEYTTAIRRATLGANWQEFVKDIDLYPNLRWTPSRSAEPRNTHEKLYGLVLPVKDPFWIDNFPGNLWNCKCGIEQTDAKASKRPKYKNNTPKGLDVNPGIEGELFSKSHPYFKGIDKKIVDILNNYLKKKKNQEIKSWYKSNIPINNLKINTKISQTGVFKITRGNIKSMTAKLIDLHFKDYSKILINDIENWKYVGYARVTPGKHNEAIFFTYYKTRYLNKTIYINAKVVSNSELPYAITPYLKDIVIKKKLPK